MKLRSKLKSKEEVEEQNEKLIEELNEYRGKYLDSQKKATFAQDKLGELQALVAKL